MLVVFDKFLTYDKALQQTLLLEAGILKFAVNFIEMNILSFL